LLKPTELPVAERFRPAHRSRSSLRPQSTGVAEHRRRLLLRRQQPTEWNPR
jgi:hypothetical protein